jgi:hypothetical protein
LPNPIVGALIIVIAIIFGTVGAGKKTALVCPRYRKEVVSLYPSACSSVTLNVITRIVERGARIERAHLSAELRGMRTHRGGNRPPAITSARWFD